MKPMHISVLYNKPAARFTKSDAAIVAEEDTEESANEVAQALRSRGAIVQVVPITETTIPEVVAALSGDLVFNLIEWTGVDLPYALATFDAMNARGIRYTGATRDNYHLTCDKVLMKKRFDALGLPTPAWQLFHSGNERVRAFHFPVIVKVGSEHSSVGLTKDAVVQNIPALMRIVRDRIARFAQPVYAEEFLSGREFQVTLIEKSSGLTVLPPAEIVYRQGTDVPFLTYESRWDMTHADYNNSDVVLPKLDAKLAKALTSMSTKAFLAFGFRDYARFDIRCLGKQPMFLEVNSNPGLGDDDQYGMTVSYKAVGMDFADVIWEIVQSAMRRK